VARELEIFTEPAFGNVARRTGTRSAHIQVKAGRGTKGAEVRKGTPWPELRSETGDAATKQWAPGGSA